jgi:3-oxoadipate enol-lactonase
MAFISIPPSTSASAIKDVHYRAFGSSDLPVLVFGNSLGTDTRLWNDQITFFQDRYRVIVFDYPGHGSPHWPGVAGFHGFAAKTAALLDALQIAQYSYCGLSMGGALGMELALQHPHRMQKLVLSNTAAQLGPADFWNQRMHVALTQGMEALASATLARWFTAEAVQADPAPYALAKEMFLATEPQGYAQCCAAIRDFEFTDRLSAIAVPTLVIAGAHDMACTPAQARLMVDAIPDAVYCELPAAHLSNLGASAAFNTRLASFLHNK